MQNDNHGARDVHDEDVAASLAAIEGYARKVSATTTSLPASLAADGILGQVERIRRLMGEVA